jgi:predicted dehydrogenase
MNALVLTGGGRPATIAVERYRTRDIEVDDTACLRLTWPAGPELTMAVSLCSTEFIPGEITVTGTGGRAVLEYPTDQLELPGEAPTVTGRVDLLENLLAYRSEPEAVALLAPLAMTESFTAVIEAIQAAPPPARIAAEWLEPQPGGPALPGIADLIRRAATGRALFSELDVPWAVPPWAAKLTEDEG